MAAQNNRGDVYFTEPFRRTMLGQIRQDIARIDSEMAHTKAELELVKAMRETLGKIQDVLDGMRALAVEAVSNPNADHAKLNRRFERMKLRVDKLAAEFENGRGMPQSNMENVRRVVAAIEAAINKA